MKYRTTHLTFHSGDLSDILFWHEGNLKKHNHYREDFDKTGKASIIKLDKVEMEINSKIDS